MKHQGKATPHWGILRWLSWMMCLLRCQTQTLRDIQLQTSDHRPAGSERVPTDGHIQQKAALSSQEITFKWNGKSKHETRMHLLNLKKKTQWQAEISASCDGGGTRSMNSDVSSTAESSSDTMDYHRSRHTFMSTVYTKYNQTFTPFHASTLMDWPFWTVYNTPQQTSQVIPPTEFTHFSQ